MSRGLLSLLGTVPRECFSNSEVSAVDVTFLCHDVRGLGDLAEDERLFVTVKDLRKHSGEQLAPMGAPCHLKTVELDASLLLRVWAARDEEAAKLRAERRNCGELRVPMSHLQMICEGLLYQTWVTLDCPGLNDSVAAVGLNDDSSTLEQRLVEGPRQLFQPRAFLTVGRSGDCEQLLAADAGEALRIAKWVPLLRSQRQHALMSAALHLQALNQQQQGGDRLPRSAETGEELSQRLAEIRGRVRAQADGMESLRREVRQAEGELEDMREATRRCMKAGTQLEGQGPLERSRTAPAESWKADGAAPDAATRQAEAEVARLRAASNVQQARREALRSEVERVRKEANDNVDAANDSIRTMRRERDESVNECKRLDAEVSQSLRRRDEAKAQNQTLSDEVSALKRLVEELYDSLNGAGLQASRKSIDSINNIFKIS